MTLESIQQEVERIREIKDDDEAAHSAEDTLYFEFIDYIRTHGPEDLAAMAKAVLTTQDISFERWCA